MPTYRSPKIMELNSTCHNVCNKKDIHMEFHVPCLTIHEVLLNIHAHIILPILRAHARYAFSCSKHRHCCRVLEKAQWTVPFEQYSAIFTVHMEEIAFSAKRFDAVLNS